MEDEARYRGTVKWFANNKGYGFIVWREGARDVFVHYSVIARSGRRNLEQGEWVEFSVRQTARGWEAYHVIPLGPATANEWGS